ncbi:MAG: tRNA pseudouridine(55) synthase TruB [Halanaerobiales bacterium]
MSKPPAIINVLKPPGMTSFDVVGYLKRVLKIKKCGHTGTLDPAASGVLPVCLNRGTKVIPFLPEDEKEYIALLKFGSITDTLDRDGEVLKEDINWKSLSEEEIRSSVASFKGKMKQLPPIYSAIKKDGKRLYKYARNGKNVDLEKRDIEIKSIKILNIDLPVIKVKVNCSKGTYIRSLARDIGKNLGTNSHLKNLLRTGSGPFKLDNTILLNQINKQNLDKITIPIDEPLNHRELEVKDYAFKYAINGTKLLEKNFQNWPTDLELGERLLIYGKDQFISISEVKLDEAGNIYIQPLRVFYNGGQK